MTHSKTSGGGDQPLRETEEAAYQAYREWPVFLVMRQKELEAHQAVMKPIDPVQPEPAVTAHFPDAVAALIAQLKKERL
jgi:hypothetical protein